MPRNRIQLNGFGRLGRIQEQVLAAGLDCLNVHQMADVPEIDIDKMEDKEVTEQFRREWKAATAATTASARRATPRGARPTGNNPAAIGLSWRNNNH